ncbi:unnamed protein product [Prunus armeniaca]|uniref:Uncharacterized protein n=1 Tax=Prunus armeniaca TaxID=36596 RepID=A0A6J5TQV1_PRUAR|nr:unnamed protein product [Prunus armeniaca]
MMPHQKGAVAFSLPKSVSPHFVPCSIAIIFREKEREVEMAGVGGAVGVLILDESLLLGLRKQSKTSKRLYELEFGLRIVRSFKLLTRMVLL